MRNDRLREKFVSRVFAVLLAVVFLCAGCIGSNQPRREREPGQSSNVLAPTDPEALKQTPAATATSRPSPIASPTTLPTASVEQPSPAPLSTATPTEEPPSAAPSSVPTSAPTAAQIPAPTAAAAADGKAPPEIAPSAYLSYRELVGDNGDYSMPHNVPPKNTYKILIDTNNQITTVYDKLSGIIVRQMLCTTGAKDTPTPKGIKRMGKGRARFGFFKDYNCYAQYCSQVVEGIYFHSVLYRKKNANSLIRSSYRNLGRPASHGCIRLAVPDARWIFYNIAQGTEVEIRSLPRNEALRSSLRLPAPPK